MKGLDLVSILTVVSGLAVYGVSLGLGDQIDTIAPGWGKKTMAFLGLASFGATIILRIIRNPTPTETTTLPTASGGTVVLKTVQKENP